MARTKARKATSLAARAATQRRWRNALTVHVRALSASPSLGEPEGVQVTVRLGQGELGSAVLLAGLAALERSLSDETVRPNGKTRGTGGGTC